MPSTSYDIDGAVATLTFTRPEARNAMTFEMYQALVNACDHADADSNVRVLILRGAGGKAFVSGTDIAQFKTFQEPQHAIDYERRINEIIGRLEAVQKPTIACIQGVAAGGGLAIALACDLRVATPDSTFGVPVARTLGNCLSGASIARFLDIMSPATVKDMLFTGRLIGGTEALALGLVNRLEAPEALDGAVRELASQIAANAPLTIRATKEAVRRVLAGQRIPPGSDHDIVTMCYMSADFREGVAAFLEKRKPQWTGT